MLEYRRKNSLIAVFLYALSTLLIDKIETRTLNWKRFQMVPRENQIGNHDGKGAVQWFNIGPFPQNLANVPRNLGRNFQ